MHWNVIPSRWTPWFRPDYSSYIGSGDDGPGDPHTGYAPYDFGSIMHYDARGNRFDTIPPEKEKLTSNRRHLSAGDISQINDVYQCKSKAPTPAPPPTPEPAPTPAPTPARPPTPAPSPTPVTPLKETCSFETSCTLWTKCQLCQTELAQIQWPHPFW